MSKMFCVHAVLEIHSATETLQQNITDILRVFPESLHLKSQQALIAYHLRGTEVRSKERRETQTALAEFDEAEAIFDEIYARDPFRVDDIDTYSNILYVMEKRAKLSAMAHKYTELDRNRPETCCLVGALNRETNPGNPALTFTFGPGNYFSLRGEHEKAVLYFRRALKLDRGYLSAWTLMGHEYVEMKNTHAAVEAYRRAVGPSIVFFYPWDTK
jgi:anaphase-promoting complex subunit 8